MSELKTASEAAYAGFSAEALTEAVREAARMAHALAQSDGTDLGYAVDAVMEMLRKLRSPLAGFTYARGDIARCVKRMS